MTEPEVAAWAIETRDLRRTFRDNRRDRKDNQRDGKGDPRGAGGADRSRGRGRGRGRGRDGAGGVGSTGGPAAGDADARRGWLARVSGKDAAPRPDFVALDGVNLRVSPGETFGLLGPNGAGKTTLIKILCTLMYPTSGQAWVAGYNVEKHPGEVKRLINMVSGGEHSGYGVLTVRETLWMFSQFYGLESREALGRIDALMDVVGLKGEAQTKISKLSTGMRQKMNFIRGFINDPRVLFLDEPTLGLDVSVSRTVRGFVRDWVRARPGRTVLLTTHYMAEADEMCDRVAIIDHGRLLACDSPAGLKRSLGRDSVVELELAGPERLTEAGLAALPGVRRASARVDAASGRASARLILEDDGAIGPLLAYVADCGARVLSFTKKEVTLEDVFLAVVGRSLNENGAGQ